MPGHYHHVIAVEGWAAVTPGQGPLQASDPGCAQASDKHAMSGRGTIQKAHSLLPNHVSSLGGFMCPATITSSQLWKAGQLSPLNKVQFKLQTLGAH